MSSRPAADPRPGKRPWSLTRRMAWTFAATTCAILAIYAAWVGSFIVGTLGDDIKNFMDHELEELGHDVAEGDGSPAAIQKSVEEVISVTPEPPCAIRVRDRDGRVVAAAGREGLLERVPEPVAPGESWRRWFHDRHVAVQSAALGDGRLRAEILVDTRAAIARMRRFGWAAFSTFLAAAVLAGVAGWVTARRGLRGLREVVAQAGSIDAHGGGGTIELHRAPTEVRAVGEALNGMLARIHEESERMRTFTAGLAHELRSPLQNLVGETEVTLLSDRGPEDYRRLLRSNLEDLYDLTDAVDNLVAWCRTTSPERPRSVPERFDLGDEAELRLGRERRSATRAGVALEFEVAGDTELEADREGCLRVIRNLVGNAILWTPAGGTVRVRVEGQAGEVRIVVDDGGPGVPPELGERIFEPFVSGRSQAGRRGGYGLGLAICRQVMEEHGGTLRYEALPAGGTRFVASFPRQGGRAPAAERLPRSPAAAGP